MRVSWEELVHITVRALIVPLRVLCRAEKAGEISDALHVRQNTLSANLSVLLGAGLVRNERQGRSIRYFADMDGLRGMLAFLLQDCCGGRSELCQPLIEEIACTC